MAIDTDFLVVGTGLAGLVAAQRLAKSGNVVLVSKAPPQETATAYAQGGIASVMDAQDSFAAHVQDTLAAGAGLCDAAVVQSVIGEAPAAIANLVAAGVAFDRLGTCYDLTREGGHSARRILHAQDFTGREISRALHAQLDPCTAVTHLQNAVAIDLITRRKLGSGAKDSCVGAYIYDKASHRVHTVRARATLLATGGAGKVYLYTSNPDVATGDGVAMAFRAGASVANMEFFQFHPTCLYHPQAKSFLISEALRGEGGVLRRRNGSPLMAGVHPLGDLAPRDVVARAIDAELKRSGEPYALLDMTGRDSAFVARRFPNIHAFCLRLGIDMTRTPIPVVPAAHYLCGGIVTNLQGESDLPGLFAAGESACTGLHGANRLASNSLLEAAVFGARAAQAMQRLAAEREPLPVVPEWDSGRAQVPDESVVVSHNWDELRRTLWNYVGIVRSDKRLDRALTRIKILQEEIRAYYWDFELTQDLIELRNLVLVAELIVASAQRRRESRGLHYTLDCPGVSDSVPKPSVVRRGVHARLVFT
jgi:L-aspartate oxidase